MVRRCSLFLVVALLLFGTYTLSQSEPKSGATSDQVSALEKRVAALETQLAEANKRLATLETERDDLTRAVATMWMGQSATPKGYTPFEFNGLKFYGMPAAPTAK